MIKRKASEGTNKISKEKIITINTIKFFELQ